MEAPTFVQRIARNYLRSMAPLPAAPPAGTGLAALHGVMASLYRAAAETPADLGLPLHPDVEPRSGSRYGAASHAVAAIPRLLYVVGLYGSLAASDGDPCLRAGRSELADRWQRAGIRDASGLLAALASHGVQSGPAGGDGDTLCVSFAHAPEAVAALASLAAAAAARARGADQAPVPFCRVDARLLMAPARGEPPITLDDALRALGGAQAEALRSLDGTATALGYRPVARCASLGRGEWRASYRHPRLAKTLFGYVVEEGALTVRLLFNRTERILPFIMASPEEVRESFFTSCACRGCGKCSTGPRSLYVDDAMRRLCSYGYHTHPDVSPDEVGALRMLLETQAQFLAADAEYA